MTTYSTSPPDDDLRRRGRTRSAHGIGLAVAVACVLLACGERTPEPPTEPSGTWPPWLNPEPLEDTCDPPPPTVAGEGEAVWSVPERVPIPFDTAVEPRLIAGDGSVYLAFEVHGPNPEGRLPTAPTDIYVVGREGAGWSEPVNISKTPTPSSPVRLSIDAAGVVHALWGEWIGEGALQQDLIRPTSIFHATAAGGEWSAPDTVWYATAEGVETPQRAVPDATP